VKEVIPLPGKSGYDGGKSTQKVTRASQANPGGMKKAKKVKSGSPKRKMW
jgi:hypothetical protein